MRLFSFSILIGCGNLLIEPSGTVKFATTTQKSWLAAAPGIFLIEQVKASSWQVLYGFSDNDGCGQQFGAEQLQQLEAVLTKSLQTWLQPLSDEEEIVAEFSLQQAETVLLADTAAEFQDKNLRTFKQTEANKATPLGVILYCEQGTALAYLPRLPRFYRENGTNDNDAPIILHIYAEQTPLQEHAITDLKLYAWAMLLHQAGHAFGLADAAADAKLPSLMNTSKLANFAISAADFKLPADDAQGILWLYEYHVEKSTELKECRRQFRHQFYRYDEEQKACVPQQPLIFMVNNSDLAALKTFLQDNPQIDINEQDRYGNTALHYAASHEDHSMYEHLLTAGADNKINNERGTSPAEILQNKSEYMLFPPLIDNFCSTYDLDQPPRSSADSKASNKFLSSASGCAIAAGNSNSYLLVLLLLLPLLVLQVQAQTKHKPHS